MKGKKLLHYDVTGKLGEGGMGVVYRALDSRLGREVAIKVLPEALARDAERLARFEREARVLASLNHPNIAAIYGLEHDADQQFLVLELVDGPTLAERLERGRLEIDEVLEIAEQIATGVSAAHDLGIVHRDLKPANVKLSSDGRVKILDFGLAKVWQEEGDPLLTQSPTLTAQMTRAGVILGTAGYMSPEQARGAEADRRSDVWAFGVILYEMLTGSRAFRGGTVSDVLASVLKEEPDLDRLPRDLPPSVRFVIERCLAKDPRERFRDLEDLRLLLRSELPAPDSAAVAGLERAGGRAGKRWGLVAGVAIAGLAIGFLLPRPRPAPRALGDAPIRNFVLASDGRTLADTQAISPDGRWVAYTLGGSLWIRNLEELEARAVPGSEGAQRPFWSPQSDAVAFVSGDALYKVSLHSGRPQRLCRIAGGDFTGGAWSAQEGLVLTLSRANWDGDVQVVPEQGGTPRPYRAADRDKRERRLHEPHFLPDGRSLLFTMVTLDANDGAIALDRDGVRTLLGLGNGSQQAVYSPTGHIVFSRALEADYSLWAVPFSLEAGEITGEAFRIAPNGAWASVADDGTLVYGARQPQPQQLVWVDRTGRVIGTVGAPEPHTLWTPAVAPDGYRVAATVNWDYVAVWDSRRSVRTRITGEEEKALFPRWLPGGDHIAYSLIAGGEALVTRRADGSGTAHTILQVAGAAAPDYSPNGAWVAYYVLSPDHARDLWALDVNSPEEAFPLLETPANEAMPRISPDGNYIAYQSDSSGRWEIYVRPFPRGDGRWQISVNGGEKAAWNPRGGEIFFVSENNLMAAEISTEGEVRIGAPKRLFSGDDLGTQLSLTRHVEGFYDVAPDGERFVVVQGVNAGRTDVILTDGRLAAAAP